MAVAKKKRGRPPKVQTDEAPSSPSAAASPTSEPVVLAAPMPVARPVEPSTLERVCARLGLTFRDVKRYDDGGGTVEIVTVDGRRLAVEREDLG